MTMRTASGGIARSVKSAEGLVFEFTGPGWVMTQSRNPRGLLDWLTANLPGQRAQRSRGGVPWPTRTS